MMIDEVSDGGCPEAGGGWVGIDTFLRLMDAQHSLVLTAWRPLISISKAVTKGFTSHRLSGEPEPECQSRSMQFEMSAEVVGE